MDAVILPRHACPTLLEPMQTGDGFLARLPPLLAPITPTQLAGIAAAAARHGNGVVEITGRGNFQIRGLAADGGPGLALELGDLGLDLPGGPPISADALLPAAHVARAAGFATTLRARLQQSGVGARLSPKVGLALDFGSRFAPGALKADIRIAFRGPQAAILIGGDAANARQLGSVPAGTAADAAFAVLDRLTRFGPFARLAGPSAIAADAEMIAGLAKVPGFDQGRIEDGAGWRDETGRPVAEIAFPFGQAGTGALETLARSAAAAGIEAVSPAPDRRLLLAGPAEAVETVRAMAAGLGFVTDAADPRRSLFACAGSEGCASGALPVRRIAAAVAEAVPLLLDGSFALHLSGCAKGCAHPEPALLTLTAIDKGLAVVLHGRPRDRADGLVPNEAVVAGLAALAEAMAGGRGPMGARIEGLGGAAVAAILAGTEAGDGSGGDGFDARQGRLSA